MPVGTPGLIRNGTAGLTRPPTVTTTLPLVAPAGIGTTMLLADHDVGAAAVPLNVTVWCPWSSRIRAADRDDGPTGPLDGEKVVMTGGTITVYGSALLARPPTVTTTLPVVAPAGNRTTMLSRTMNSALRQCLEGDGAAALLAPKVLPLMATAVATGPLEGERLAASAARSQCM